MNQFAAIMGDRAQAARRVAARLMPVLGKTRIMTDPVMTFAYSGDASAYRLVPAIVVIVNTEDEVRAVIAAARAEQLPLTFRAAGTSLSGQAITDGVLAVLGDGWLRCDISEQGDAITLGPAVIVAAANRALKPFNRKLGPDPASQATCKIGGVVNNNSSGMCCGVAHNTYHTMTRLRLILTDGTGLDSADPQSSAAFRQSHADLLAALASLRHDVLADAQLLALIRRKYKIKNTVGYSLNALIDFADPLDILIHLIVGSEGTLGFVSEITYRTVPEHPFKATGLIPFAAPHACAKAISALANGGVQATTGVTAAEYIERRALATVQHHAALAPLLPFLTETSPAVLIDVTAPDAATLGIEVDKASAILAAAGATDINFSTDPERSSALWDIRKGFFASGGAARPPGTSMLTEDVAAPIDRLADFVIALRDLLDACGYDDAIIFGHALAGNIHFQMSDDFSKPEAAAKFDAFSKRLSALVSVEFAGSLKAEHGTGRAIAPFVEAEWGEKAYGLMQAIKTLFDPEGLLNPGVLLNTDPDIHIKNLKLMPLADPLIDLCIECGFCEPACPSTHLTLTPRQRIVVTRERARLRASGEDPERLTALDEGFQYSGLDTCAACNLCATRCPVGIATGTMILAQRAEKRSASDRRLAGLAADHPRAVENLLAIGIGAQSLARTLIGDGATDGLAGTMRKIARTPQLSKALRPGPGAPPPQPDRQSRQNPKTSGFPVPTALMPDRRVIYFPACGTRLFGAPQTNYDLLPTTEAMLALLRRAGFDPIVPEPLTGLCCGQPFLSKGFPAEAERLGTHLAAHLARLGEDGRYPVITDASTCAAHLGANGNAITMQDSAVFLLTEVLPCLTITRPIAMVAVHHNCSAQRLTEQQAIETLAAAAAHEVAVLSSITCCGAAGDKALFVPELLAHATRFARNDIPAHCDLGISTAATCASGLSGQLGMPFVSLAALLEYVSRPAGP